MTQTTKRIGIVVGGGDCPGLNAVIRAVMKSAALRGWTVFGALGGYEGLLSSQGCQELDYRTMGNLLTRGGSILGTASHGRFAAKVGRGEERQVPNELLDAVKSNMSELGISALVVLGGDGTLSTAWQFSQRGIPVVGVPKTIDNDLNGTDKTFGFDSAVACATEALDRLHTTAESHNRLMVLETMGRYAGWIALYAGIAGGADVILIPEIPFCYDAVCAQINERERRGRHFSIIVVAEGAHEQRKQLVVASSRSEGEVRLGGIGPVVAAELERRTAKESRCCVLGHLQRGGIPTIVDRTLCSIYGAAAIEQIAAGNFGTMVSYYGDLVTAVSLEEAVRSVRTVPVEGTLIQAARAIGISLGNETAGVNANHSGDQ